MKIPRIPKHLLPLLLLFLAGIAGLIAARRMLVPDTFGEYGHYRAQAIQEILSQEILYAGYRACLDCHDDPYELEPPSNHKGLSCEVCHGPAAKHVEEPGEYTPGAPRGRGYCPLCHGYDPSRPTGFPQIIPRLHNPGKACMSCHDPHNPLLPYGPEECTACHRAIVSEKLVSHHVTLSCTTCHTVPEEHLVNPRFVRAIKPTTREFCGRCHAKGADSPKEIPRINLETHGERYRCWDCHYPHHPEAKK